MEDAQAHTLSATIQRDGVPHRVAGLLELAEEREKARRTAGAHDLERLAELPREFLRQVHAPVAVDDRLEHHEVGPFDRRSKAVGTSSSDVPTVVFEPMACPLGKQGELGFVAFDPTDNGDVHPTLPVIVLSHDVRVVA
jgi:hypothetical protein